MKRFVLAIGAVGALLALADLSRSGDDKGLRAIIDKAIEAQGGEAVLAKFPAATVKGTGKFYGLGEPIDFSMELAGFDKKFRFGMDMTVMSMQKRNFLSNPAASIEKSVGSPRP